MAPTVLHLVGSPTSRFSCDLSRLYASDCLEATADPARWTPVVAYVTPDGRWRFPADLSAAAIAAADPLDVGAALSRIVDLRIDAALPQMFCAAGMTAYRGLLDVLGIPYVGNGPDAMALTLDKARAKAVVAAAGVAVPRGEVLRPGGVPTVAPPAVVKPVDADNSLGVSLVRRPEGWAAALAAGFEHGERVLVEEYVELGREVRCGLVDLDGELVGLPLEEYAVDPVGKPVRRADDKLRVVPGSGDGLAGRDAAGADGPPGGGDGLGLVAKDLDHAWIVDPSDPLTAVVWDAARRAHRALGCRHYSLWDFRIDPAGRPVFLEGSLYCSYARQSVIPTMAAAAGIELADLLALGLRAAGVDVPPVR